MKFPKLPAWVSHLAAAFAIAGSGVAQDITFPKGTATDAQECGVCHEAIYREFAFGFGSDLRNKPTTLEKNDAEKVGPLKGVPPSGTAHSFAGTDSYPVHARTAEEEGRSCNVCHYPQPFSIPDPNVVDMPKPTPRPKDQETGGLTCASCHLTPDGKIRGPHAVKDAPHATVQDPAIQTSAMCAYCHSMGKRVSGKQTQTFFEWREDFSKPGLGKQHCQDCHMPRTIRKLSESSDAPERAVARHLWTGGRSLQRIQSALSLVAVQPEEGKGGFALHIINIGAGHSVPTGSNRRAVYLEVEVFDSKGKKAASSDWMFAPWYGPRPDDRKFLEEDKKRPDAIAAIQADAQGPHEAPIKAGEERILSWLPKLKAGTYTLKARLIYDLNRYNDRSFKDDQTEFNSTALSFVVK
jgi:nitrate/TMAO reductase-like tetraheme cytochrome c subunit